MASVVVSGDTSGSVSLSAPAVAGTTTLTLPTFNGTVGLLVSGTSVASTSGTSIDFTSIPAGVRRITVMFSGVSTSGSSVIQVQLGDGGGMENTGYLSTSSTTGGTVTAITSGFAICTPAAASVVSGHCVITLIDSANTWIQTSLIKSATNTMAYSAGNKATSDTLTQIRITTVNGTDTFDAGTINILYE
jgi:hypothetical protein